ncbi:MAG: ATP-binding protein [bacterium]
MNNQQILIELIEEWNKDFIPSDLKERDFDYGMLDFKNKALILVGLRRSGKSYLMFQIIKKISEKNPRSNLLYINFEDERLLNADISLLTEILPAIKTNFEIDEKKPLYLFLDEIQSIKGWEKWARRILDKEKNVKIVITGSSSKLSSAEIATEMRGRSIAYFVHPLSFKEFLNFKKIDIPENLSAHPDRFKIQKAFKEYLLWGGLPEIVLLNKKRDKIIVLQEYFNTIINKEIKERHNIENQAALDALLKLLVSNFASLVSLSKLHKIMASIGINVGKNTLADYLIYIKESFFIDFIEIFSYNIKNKLQYPRKSYVADAGFIRALSSKTDLEKGRLLENLVFNTLKRKSQEINYFQDVGETDFLLKNLLKITETIQATCNLNDHNSKREIDGLLEAMRKFSLKEGLIITENTQKELKYKIDGKKVKIKIMPIWQWLLEV